MNVRSETNKESQRNNQSILNRMSRNGILNPNDKNVNVVFLQHLS